MESEKLKFEEKKYTFDLLRLKWDVRRRQISEQVQKAEGYFKQTQIAIQQEQDKEKVELMKKDYLVKESAIKSTLEGLDVELKLLEEQVINLK